MGLRYLHTNIFIETPSLEGLSTKAKQDLSPHEMRLSTTEHQPSISWSSIIFFIISYSPSNCPSRNSKYFRNFLQRKTNFTKFFQNFCWNIAFWLTQDRSPYVSLSLLPQNIIDGIDFCNKVLLKAIKINWYGKTRVTIYELRVTSYELQAGSLKARVDSLKAQVKIQKCEFKSTNYDFKSTNYEFKSTSHEFKSTSYEFKLISYQFKSTSSKIIKSMKTRNKN